MPTKNVDEQRQLFQGFSPQGFEGLQLKGGQYGQFLKSPGEFLDRWGGFDGARAGLICGGNLNEDGVANLRRIFDFAAAIGSEMVIFCHGRPRTSVTNDDLRAFARQLSELGEESLSRGVKLSLHHHFDNPVMHYPDFEVFFEAITPGNVGLTVDTAHLQKSGVFDIAGVVRDFGDFLDNVHLKDYADGQFKTLGCGEIEFGPVFAALREIGFRGWLCADEESETGITESLRASFNFIEGGWKGSA